MTTSVTYTHQTTEFFSSDNKQSYGGEYLRHIETIHNYTRNGKPISQAAFEEVRQRAMQREWTVETQNQRYFDAERRQSIHITTQTIMVTNSPRSLVSNDVEVLVEPESIIVPLAIIAIGMIAAVYALVQIGKP